MAFSINNTIFQKGYNCITGEIQGHLFHLKGKLKKFALAEA